MRGGSPAPSTEEEVADDKAELHVTRVRSQSLEEELIQ